MAAAVTAMSFFCAGLGPEPSGDTPPIYTTQCFRLLSLPPFHQWQKTQSGEDTCPRSHSRKAWRQNANQAVRACAPSGAGVFKPVPCGMAQKCSDECGARRRLGSLTTSVLGALGRRALRNAKLCLSLAVNRPQGSHGIDLLQTACSDRVGGARD